jgi:hypothetical protein
LPNANRPRPCSLYSNEEADVPKDESEAEEPKTDAPSKFDDEAAKPIASEKATSEEDVEAKPEPESSDETASTDESDSEETPEVTYRQPEDNAYKGSDGGPGSENASEIPLPPTED